ncbi:MAG: Crp/Fnr family transcriptional regulator [Anaerolineae bacterium]|nr:Crp/Fnr family transcriptional regulator [Anaerolineae bacterium]MDW8098240.1 Crp/Fnr family transcriptional regulator [Anaerolineae bacterium]
MMTSMNPMTLTRIVAQLPAEDPAFGQAVTIKSFRRGETVATPDELEQFLYILMSGCARLVRTTREGRRLVLAVLESGAIFGEGALLNAPTPDTFVEAQEDCTVWAIPAAEAKKMTSRHPILGWGLLQTFGARLAQVEARLEDVAYKKLPERLAALLLELADHRETTITGVSHQSLADTLGTYRETVSSILRDFKRQGLVSLGYRRIKILDAYGLAEIAGLVY